MLKLRIQALRFIGFNTALFFAVLLSPSISAAPPPLKPLNEKIIINTADIINSNTINSTSPVLIIARKEESSNPKSSTKRIKQRESKSNSRNTSSSQSHKTFMSRDSSRSNRTSKQTKTRYKQNNTARKQKENNRTAFPQTTKKKKSIPTATPNKSTDSIRVHNTTDKTSSQNQREKVIRTWASGSGLSDDKADKLAEKYRNSTNADIKDAIENATVENDFGVSAEAIRESAENSGKTEAEIREGLGIIESNNATLGGDERNSESAKEYLKDPSAETLDREALKTYAAENNIPFDKLDKALSKEGKPVKFSDLVDLESNLEGLGVSDDPDYDTSSDKFWDKVAKEGTDQIKKEATGTALNLPDNASKNPDVDAKDLFEVVAEMEFFEPKEGAENDVQSEKFWDKVANKGLDQVRKDIIGNAYGLRQKEINDPNLSPKDLLKIVEVKFKKEEANLAEKAAEMAAIKLKVNLPGGNSSGNSGKTGGNSGTGTASGTSSTGSGVDVGIPGVGVGGNPASEGNNIPGSNSNSSNSETSVGAGAPGSGQTGVGSNEHGTGFGAGNNPANPGEEAPRSGSGVVITDNGDGSFTAHHFAVVDAGDGKTEANWFDVEIYREVNGVFFNQRGDKFVNLQGTGVPAEGAYPTEFNDDGNYTVYDTEDEDEENNNNGNDASSNNDDDNSDDDNSDDEDDEDDNNTSEETSTENTDSEDDDDSKSDEKDESTTPVPDGNNPYFSTPGKIYQATGGRLGGEEEKNTERAIATGTGAAIGAPEPQKAYDPQKDQGQIKIPTGGEAGAPDKEGFQYISVENLRAINLRLKGGGAVDPPAIDGSTGSGAGGGPGLGGGNPLANTQNLSESGDDGDDNLNTAPVFSLVDSLQGLSALQDKISNIQSTLNK